MDDLREVPRTSANHTTIPVLSNYELWSLLDHSAFSVSRLREVEVAEFDLTVEQSATLDFMRRKGGPTTIKEIEDVTLRQHHSISILINRMIKAGLLVKERVSFREGYQIFLAEKGESLIDRVTSTSIESVFGPFETKDRDVFAAALRSLRARARELLGIPHLVPFMKHIADAQDESTDRDADMEGYPSDYELWSLLDRARFAVARLRELELSKYGLTIEQAAILRVVEDTGGSTTARSLEEITMRQHNSVSTLLIRMISMELLAKKASQPGGSRTIVITDQGKSVLAEITTNALDMTFSALTQKEKRKLTAYLCVTRDRARSLLGYQEVPVAVHA